MGQKNIDNNEVIKSEDVNQVLKKAVVEEVVDKNIDDRKSEENKSQRSGKRGALLVVLVVIAVIATLVIYNLLNDRKNRDVVSEFPLSLDQVKQDFENIDNKSVSDVIPPDSYKDRFNESINVSLNAIETGIPSRTEFNDLLGDYFNIASSYSIIGEYAMSEEWYFKLLEQWPDDYKTHLNLGDLYILMGRRQDAAVKFFETVELYPNDFRVYGKFADLYTKYSIASDKLEKADMIYEYGIEVSDDPRSLYKDYSFFLEMKMKDYEKSLEMEREYQKVSGNVSEDEILRLEELIQKNN